MAALLPMPLMAKDEPTKVPPGTPVTITVQPAAPAAPTVSPNWTTGTDTSRRCASASPTRAAA